MTAVSWRPSAVSRPSGISRVSARVRRESSGLSRRPRPAEPLETRFLHELASAHADVQASIDAAMFSTAPAGDLLPLRGELRRRLDQLLDVLFACSDEKNAVDALVPFVFFVDEQVERALSSTTDAGYYWPQLQRDLFPEGRAEGGDVFFERAEALLDEPAPRPPVVSTYLFCLKAEFRGRLADEPEDAVNRWIDDLASKLPKPTPRSEPTRLWFAPPAVSAHFGLGLIAIFTFHLIVLAWAYWQ